MKIPHPALGKKFCTSGEFRLAKNSAGDEKPGSETVRQEERERRRAGGDRKRKFRFGSSA